MTDWFSYQEENEKRAKEWEFIAYIGKCPKCNRQRLCECANGMHKCDKCDYCPQLDKYVDLML